jgi:hypothetical protein
MRYEGSPKKAAPVSQAPAPIKPIEGSARGSYEPLDRETARNFEMQPRWLSEANRRRWLGTALTVDQATAISMNYDPDSISLDSVLKTRRRVNQSSGNDYDYAEILRIQGLARVYSDRHQQILLAAQHGQLPAMPFGTDFKIMPHDLLDWFPRRYDREPRRALPNVPINHFRDEGPLVVLDAYSSQVIAAPADTKGLNTEGETGLPPVSDELNNERGVAETWLLMWTERRKPPNERKYTMQALKAYCEDEFDIRQRDFEALRKYANKLGGTLPSGRPKKARSKVTRDNQVLKISSSG